MENAGNNLCPRCGGSLHNGQVDGLCACCLGALNFATDTALSGAVVGSSTDFSREDLEKSFPQLEILELLGRGGMGIVYKARQKELGRLVALKLLPPERVVDSQFAERFRREAQALASLTHPNIVAIHDFGQTNGLFFLLMEFVDGVNLRQAMNAGRFTPDQALAIVPPVCEALQFAHEHGIVHRDIKPENLLLDKRGHVKIADFGIAKILGQDAASADIFESQPAGTPQYMAPEQTQPGSADHRTDIYSLGVVLYEMLTGELPESRLQPPSRRIQVDVRIDQIVLRALEKSPEMRFNTADEFRISVETAIRSDGSQLAPDKRPAIVSRFASLGAAWAAVCLASLPFLEGAWIGGVISTVLGWLAVGEIRRPNGRVRGLWLAVLVGLIFPLLMVNVVMVAAYARFVAPIRNQPYPAMVSPTWPFIVFWLGLLTLLLIVLLDTLVAWAVWRRLTKARVNGHFLANPWSWRVVTGSLLALFGVAVLFGAPAVNERVDDFALTKSARYYLQEHRRASEKWTESKAAAATAVVSLEAARQAPDVEEIERLTRDVKSLHEAAARAEFAVNQIALQKQESERQRLAVLKLVGGSLIAGGLLIYLRVARRKSSEVSNNHSPMLKVGSATLVTPSELASFWEQCFCYRTRGTLLLDENVLTHSCAERLTLIPLDRIRDVSIGRLPRLMNLAGLNVLSIAYDEDGAFRQVLISPVEGWLRFSQDAVFEWFTTVRKAVVATTGKSPTITPAEQLGIPRSSRLIFAALLAVPILVLLALYLKHANDARKVATPAASGSMLGDVPVSTHISRNHHSVLAVHDDSTLHYVLYFSGDILSTSSGSKSPTDNTWVDEGAVKLSNGRAITYSRRSLNPNELRINGASFDLLKGRVVVLRDDGTPQQIRLFPTLDGARDPESLARLIVAKVDETAVVQTGAPNEVESTFLRQPAVARANAASSPKFDDRVFVFRTLPIPGEIVDHNLSTREILLNVGARDGVHFGYAFQINSAISQEPIGVAKVMEIEATRCVAKVISLDSSHSTKSLKGATAICTMPKPDESGSDIVKHFDNDVWQTESRENKIIRELLRTHDDRTRILISH